MDGKSLAYMKFRMTAGFHRKIIAKQFVVEDMKITGLSQTVGLSFSTIVTSQANSIIRQRGATMLQRVSSCVAQKAKVCKTAICKCWL